MAVCGFTGYRYEKLPFSREDGAAVARLQERLRRACIRAIDAGCTRFISGFAEGSDLLFADAVLSLAREYGVTLEAALPFPNSCARWRESDRALYLSLLPRCDSVYEASQRPGRRFYLLRNDYIVSRSDRMIAVYDGKPGGTAYTLRRAQEKGVAIDLIKP
ncbi:MAG: SLOG family protein [Clostridia bacterium]|nr:SLOG family protein [Clostridia bacterium]